MFLFFIFCFLASGCREPGAYFPFIGGREPAAGDPLEDFPIYPLRGAALVLDIVGCCLSHRRLLLKGAV